MDIASHIASECDPILAGFLAGLIPHCADRPDLQSMLSSHLLVEFGSGRAVVAESWAVDAIDEAKSAGLWTLDPWDLVCELANPDRLHDLAAEVLRDRYSPSVADVVADGFRNWAATRYVSAAVAV